MLILASVFLPHPYTPLVSLCIPEFIKMAQPLASASASSSASSHGNYSYQIFINHRGSDVKKTFASHLYRRLLSYGFRVFLDQPELQRGEEIDSQIKGAIETASVHVAIFSPGYAQSSWCLDELVLMLKSMESGAATVIPVFYKVKPSNLRWTDKKRGYAKAFLNHEEKGRYSKERLAGWRKALSDVSHISGFELEACNGDEGVLVDEVVRQVQKKVGKAPLPVATHQTGLDEKLQQLETSHGSSGTTERDPTLWGLWVLVGWGKPLSQNFSSIQRDRITSGPVFYMTLETLQLGAVYHPCRVNFMKTCQTEGIR